MALGWGLWEGPARFYFWPYKLLPEDLQTDNPLKPKQLFEVPPQISSGDRNSDLKGIFEGAKRWQPAFVPRGNRTGNTRAVPERGKRERWFGLHIEHT